MRRLAPLLFATMLLGAAGSAPVPIEREPADLALARARAEAASAGREAQRLEQAADNARGEANRLRAAQSAEAAGIVASEARISAADARARLFAGIAAERRARLARRQRPVAGLVAGLAMMARNPPLLALADGGSTDDFVRVRALLDTTLPVIRARTAALAAEVAAGERLARNAARAGAELTSERDELARRQRRFAALERQALARSGAFAGEALDAGDLALARGEDADQGERDSARRRAGARLTAELAAFGPPPPRPVAAEGRPERPPLAFQLPIAGRVTSGLGEVGPSGIRSRGLTIAAPGGAALRAPADGRIAFVGPFRRHDGIVIIDHGGGWMSLIVNVRTSLAAGTAVRRGDELGRALGDVGVELSRNGRWVSAALIAGSPAPLSNGAERR